MKQPRVGVLCGVLALLLCLDVCTGFSVGSPRRRLLDGSESHDESLELQLPPTPGAPTPSNCPPLDHVCGHACYDPAVHVCADPSQSRLCPLAFPELCGVDQCYNTAQYSCTNGVLTPTSPTPTPPIISTPTPPVILPTPPPPAVTPGSGPIGNWFRCAPQFELVVFSVRENYTSPSTSDIFDIKTGDLIGLAAGNCPDIPDTLSPTGSDLALQECVFTYMFFERGMIVETGTFDPSDSGVSNNAATGVDGEFFQALGLEHIENFADASGAIDTFYMCEVRHKKKDHNKHHHKDHDKDHDKDHHKDHDKDHDKDHGKDHDKDHVKDHDKDHDKDHNHDEDHDKDRDGDGDEDRDDNDDDGEDGADEGKP